MSTESKDVVVFSLVLVAASCLARPATAPPGRAVKYTGRLKAWREIISNVIDPKCRWGCILGCVRPEQFAFASLTTNCGELQFYLGKGEFTTGMIPAAYFGCAGVARIERMQEVLLLQHCSRGHIP